MAEGISRVSSSNDWISKMIKITTKIMKPNFDSLNFVVLLGMFALLYIPVSAIAIVALIMRKCG